ncbi:MAG: hypothetical protein H0V17_29755 [Deltaproteobacteria bacterium]|nr:hypothetical protein [Deltaproteobacteria bacterium]
MRPLSSTPAKVFLGAAAASLAALGIVMVASSVPAPAVATTEAPFCEIPKRVEPAPPPSPPPSPPHTVKTIFPAASD